MKKILIIAAAAAMFASCGREKFAEINTNPNAVATPEPSYLALTAMREFISGEYTIRFYAGNRYVRPWSQMTVGDRGSFNSSTMFVMDGRLDNSWSWVYNNMGKTCTKLQYVIENLDDVKKASYESLYQMTKVMTIFKGIQATDFQGELCYSEAWKALDYDSELLTPKYDTQEEMLTLMNTQLKEAVDKLVNPASEQVVLKATQDITYGGDYTKWAKFANALRLRIALRLMYVNPTLASEIAAQVGTSGVYMKTTDDEYRHHKGTTETEDTGAGTWPGSAGKTFVEFLKVNKDPRVRFLFSKNPYNPGVMQGMLDGGVTFPAYIADQAVIENGKFIRWKSAAMGDGAEYLGEPWVRYQGLPEQSSDQLTAVQDQYNNSDKFSVNIGDVKRSFMPYSPLNYFATVARNNFTYPSMKTTQDIYYHENRFHDTFVVAGAAESKLILALFALKGTNVGTDAATLYAEAIRASVESYDLSAQMHNQPYYSEAYDKTVCVNPVTGLEEVIEQPIGLQKGEITALLGQPAYELTGTNAEKAEKIFIQLMIDSFNQISNTYTTIRLGGIPKLGSTILPRAVYTKADPNGTNIPRRMKLDTPDEASLNYPNKAESLTRQGFIPAANPTPAVTETVWYDSKSPAWGAGPKGF